MHTPRKNELTELYHPFRLKTRIYCRLTFIKIQIDWLISYYYMTYKATDFCLHFTISAITSAVFSTPNLSTLILRS